MTTAYTSLLGLALPVTGELNGAWGDVVNNSITSLLDSAIAGTTTLSSDADVTLTTTSGTANTSREAILLWSAGGTATRYITAPAQSKIYTVINASSGTQSIVLRASGPTTGVTIAKGEAAVCAWNGSDFIKISNTSGAGLFTSITNAGLTSGRVVYSTTGGLETDSANLVFDGTTLSVGGQGSLANATLTANGGIAAKTASGSGTVPYLQLYNGNAGTNLKTWRIGNVTSGDLSIETVNDAYSAATGRMTILSGGNVGIGTNSPAQKLDVNGDALIYGVTVGRGGGAVVTNTAVGASALISNTTGIGVTAFGASALYSNTASNNTAVGTASLYANTTGTFNLAVGAALAGGANGTLGANTTGSYNTGIGARTLQANTTASSNTAVGYAVMYYNTTGAFNTAIGESALTSNTTASNNTAVGYQCMYSNTTGTGTAVGYQALLSNTTGSVNVAIGWSALGSNTTGTGNTAIGQASSGVFNGALYANTTGTNNTAIGAGALIQNTTASNNTAVGYQAGYSNTTGTELTALGVNALRVNTTGGYNTASGAGALQSNTTGSRNSAFGDSALSSNTTGDFNTAVGMLAGYSNTTSGNSVYIGYQAGYSATGAQNIGVGSSVPGFYNASLYSATGSGNTALGAAAGGGISSGNTNIAIGSTAMAVGPVTGSTNVAIGWGAGLSLTSGSSNTFVGSGKAGFLNGAGNLVTTGSANTILGTYSGNQGGLDIRTASNYIVLSDGDGVPRIYVDNLGNTWFTATTSTIYSVGTYNSTTATASNINVRSDGAFQRSTSALKYKQDVRDLEEMDINLLRPVRYKSKCENDDQTKDHLGLIADEAAEAGFEELITRGNDGEVEGFQYERLTVILLKKLQTQDAIIKSLKTRLDAANF